MSYYETQRTTYYRPAPFGRFGLFPPVIKSLLISNVVFWVLLDLIASSTRSAFLAELGGQLALWPLGTHFWPWQLLTYMFLHGGFWHLFFNMLALWMFGIELEYTWGSRKFLTYYLACGLGGGVANLLVAPLLGQVEPTVGASGAVFGVLVAFGMMYPDRPIYLYFLLPIRAKYFVLGYIGLELFLGVNGSADGVAHFAHLGGAGVGLLIMLVERGTIPLGNWWTRFRGARGFPSMHEQRLFHGDAEIHEAHFYDLQDQQQQRPPAITQELIDQILDKIGREGYQSLSEEERRILNEASKHIH
jgi:membrane associated rhomboid family serine protease